MKYQSEQLGVIHESAKDLYALGIISAERMREYDNGCIIFEPSKNSQESTASNSASKGDYN